MRAHLVDRIGNLGHDCDIVCQLLARSKSVRSRPSHLNALLKLGESESSLILRRDEPKLRSAEPICIAIMSRVISGRSPSSRAKLGAFLALIRNVRAPQSHEPCMPSLLKHRGTSFR